jgi:hypothetical protein
MWWLNGDLMAQRGCGSSGRMWWLNGDLVAQRGCGGSEGMWWLSGDVVAQWGSNGSVGMWWISGDVVAQLGMWRHSWLRRLSEPDYNAAVPGSISASSTSPQSPDGLQEL